MIGVPDRFSRCHHSKPQKHDTMKRTLNVCGLFAVITVAILAVGCGTTQNSRNLAVAAGFHPVTPTNPQQEALLAKLPPDQVSPATYQGKSFYVLPDAANNRAYIGGPKQYQAFEQLRTEQQISNENLMSAQMNEMATMDWNMWGGWGTWGPGFW